MGDFISNAGITKLGEPTEEYKGSKPYAVVQYAHTWSELMNRMSDNECVRIKVIGLYMDNMEGVSVSKAKADKSFQSVAAGAKTDDARVSNNKFFEEIKQYKANNYSGANVDEVHLRTMAQVVWKRFGEDYVNNVIISPCYLKKDADSANAAKGKTNTEPKPGYTSGPFDMRLSRFEIEKDQAGLIMPYNIGFSDITTAGYIIGVNEINKLAPSEQTTKFQELRKAQYDQMTKDTFYRGVPALMNSYALVRLYGTNGGQFLVNEKGKRRWYEVDQTNEGINANFASIPTTSALISWGNGDPHGRTPYHFTDFVFSKYWKKIENNRLITLRRFAAPILDNLKFPGMGGYANKDGGSVKEISFPPMATAITYFGGETGNSINQLLKFTTGVLWEDAQASVWEVNAATTPDSEKGPGKLYGELTRFAEMLNVAGGNFDRELVQNAGALPPDPYANGPYENRIMGPINRIDSVKKRKAGLAFEWGGLNLVFEYVARPVGGINPKAAILDIMSNFLVIGSASAVFFGGAHRFMTDPAKYPFLGGNKGIEKWYQGDPIGWGTTALEDLTGKAQVAGSGFWENAKAFMNTLMGGEGGGKLFGGMDSLFSTGAIGNIAKNAMAKKTAGQIPYLQGMKAILTGEPVGEWHVTIGNPLNPIAMIGNLVCEGIDVEFNEELGPDDFPTEIKITVKLKHAMARDRDAIESVFNRGMGRLYSLPEGFLGSADMQTRVDQATKTRVQTGTAPDPRFKIIATQQQTGRTLVGAKGIPNPLGGSVSVWNRGKFDIGLSENTTLNEEQTNSIFRSAYRAADWIAMKSLD